MNRPPSLDPKTSVEIMELMRDLAAENNIPVMINIHQVELGKRYAERVIGMSGGLVVYDGARMDWMATCCARFTAAKTGWQHECDRY